MSVVFHPIYTKTFTTSTAGAFTFNNIPQQYTDLMVAASTRTDAAAYVTQYYVLPNTDTTNIASWQYMLNTGTTGLSSRAANTSFLPMAVIPGSSSTSGIFGNAEWWFNNYSSTTKYKSMMCHSVSERDSATNFGQQIAGGTYRTNTAITTLYFPVSGNFITGTTFTLYGVLRAGI